MNPGSDDITVRRAPLVAADRYGKKARDWANATDHTVSGVSVQALTAVEQSVDREYASTRVALFAPYEADLTATDRVTWRGQAFEVDGEPFQWVDDVGQVDHLYAILKRMTG
jgi:head-tail adaptor